MSPIKTLLLIPVIAFCSNLSGQSVWQQTSQPIGPNYREVEAFGDTLFAVKWQTDSLYRSLDNGQHWLTVPQIGNAQAIYKAGNILVVEWIGFQVSRSISEDRGETWKGMGFSPNSSVVYALGDSVYVYVYDVVGKLYNYQSLAGGPILTTDSFDVIVDVASYGNDFFALSFDGIFYSPDNGHTWQQTIDADTVSFSNPPSFNSYDSRLTVSENYLYLSKPGEGLYRSGDKGASWTFVYPPQGSGINWGNVRMHTEGDTLFYAAGYVFRSTDNGETWQIRSNLGNSATDLSVDGNNWYVASNTGAYRSPDRGFTWYAANGLVDDESEAPGVLDVAASGGHVYYSTGQGLFVSHDEGKTFHFSLLADGYLPVMARGDTVFYLAQAGLKFSTDGGEHFQTIATPQPGGVSEMLGYQHNRLVVYRFVSTGSNGIHKFSPVTQEFELWTGGIYDSHALHKDILMHYNPNTAQIERIFWDGSSNWVSPPGVSQWSVYGMWSTGNAVFMAATDQLFRSLDDGVTWVQIALPETGAYIYRMSGNGDRIVVNANTGLFFSKDNGTSWEPFNDGLTVDPGQYKALYTGEGYAYYNGGRRLFRRDFDDFFRLKGEVYEDVNNNGIRDNGEAPASGALVTLSPEKYAVRVDAAGQFSGFPVLEGDTLGIAPVSPYATVKPAFHQVTLSDTLVSFGVYYIPGKRDLTPSVTSLTPVRPGFQTGFYLTCQNNGTATASGKVLLVLPPELSYLSASPLPNLVSPGGDTLTWQLDQIKRFENQTIILSASCIASVSLGSQLCIRTAIETTGTDANPADNVAQNCFTVVGSFDPNDKQSEPGEHITTEQLADGQAIVYTVRFQNTGTYPAEKVTIEDTLDLKNLDLRTFRVIASSHPMTWSLGNKGLLRFVFDNINLPDSASSEPQSHGFVQYSVRPKPDLVIGDAIRNTAYIYFDFNLPVVTNTTETKVTLPDAIFSSTQRNNLSVYPNPASTLLRVSSEQLLPAGRLEIRDALGNLRLEQPFATIRQTTFDIHQLPAGWYVLRVVAGKGEYSLVFEKI